MANSPTRICVFNINPNQVVAAPIVPNQTGSNLIDIVTGVDGAVVRSLGAASYGVPVVLNPNGVLDPSLLNTGVTAVAGVNLQLGAPLVHLYSVGGTLYAELADAGGGSPPSPALSAQGFLTSPIDAGLPGTVAFSGLFTYIDQNSEFSLASVGAEVYLSAVTPGGITLTRPGSPSLDQTVGYVVAFAAPNVVTAIFLAGFNDFSRLSGCLTTSQICSVQGNGALVQLTTGAPPPSPVTVELGSAANYAVLASAGITNTGSTSITGGVIGSSPTPSITGFNPPPAVVDNADAGAAQTAAVAAYTYYSTLPSGTIISSVASQVFTPGTYTASSTLLFSGGTVTLNGAGVYIFQVGSALNVTTGPTIFVLTNGATAANVIWVVGSAATFDANQATGTFVGTIIAQAGISFVGGTLHGRAISTGASVTFGAAETIVVPSGAGSITAGDIVIFDGFGNTQDSSISLAGLISGLFVNPMTTDGDMIYNGLTGSPPVLGPLRLPIGTTGQALTVVGGIPAWGDVVNSFNTRTGAVTFTLADIPQSGATTGEAIVWNGSAWTPSFAAETSFTDILTGVNTTATMTVGPGAVLTFSGSGSPPSEGEINANFLYGTQIGGTPPVAGQVLQASSGTVAGWVTLGPGVAGGSPTQIQFNNAGTLDGAANSAVDPATGQVTLGNFTNPAVVGTALTVNSGFGGGNIQDWFNADEGFVVADLTSAGVFEATALNILNTINFDIATVFVRGGDTGAADIPDQASFNQSLIHDTAPATITATAIASNGFAQVLTVTAVNTFKAGQRVLLNATAEAFLNGHAVEVLPTGLSGTQFEAYFAHPSYSNGADTGTAVGRFGSYIDGYGSIAIVQGVLPAGLARAALTVSPDAGPATPDAIAAFSGAVPSLLTFEVDNNGNVFITPGAVGGNPSLSVTGTSVTNVIASFVENGAPSFGTFIYANGAMAIIPDANVANPFAASLTVFGDSTADSIVNLLPNGGAYNAFTFSATNNSDAILTMSDGTGGDSATFFVGGNESNIALSDLAGDHVNIGGNAGTCNVSLQDSTSAQPNVTLQSVGGLPFVVLQKGASLFKSFIGQGTGLANPTTFNLPPTDGTAGYLLQTDGAGNTSWVAAASATPAFSSITTGVNTTATMTVGPGAVLTFSGAGSPPSEGEINANFLYGVQISAVAPTVGQVLTATSGTTANWAASPQTFMPIEAGSPPEPYEFLTGYDASTGLFSAAPFPTTFSVITTGGLETAIVTKTADYTATDTDHTINCNGTFTLTLPTTGISVGQEYYLKNIGTGTITVSSAANIDFSTSLNLTTPGQSIIVQWDGTQWWIY